jgi:hypothetical protein
MALRSRDEVRGHAFDSHIVDVSDHAERFDGTIPCATFGVIDLGI